MSTYANSSVTCYKNFLNVNKYSVMRKNVIVYHLTTMNDYKIRFIKTFDKMPEATRQKHLKTAEDFLLSLDKN